MEAFVYRRRRPAETPLYRMLESLYECLKGYWEERFEHRYGGHGGEPLLARILLPAPRSAALHIRTKELERH